MIKKLVTRVFRRIPRWVKVVVLFGTGALLLLLIWGVAIEPRLFEEREEIVHIFDLPPAWEGQQVALIADLQVGMWLGNTDTIRRIVARLVEIRPATVLIAGDFIYHPLEDEPEDVREDYEPDEFEKETIEEARKVTDLLRPLTAAGLPTYAVLGNHDYGIKTRAVQPLPQLADRVQSALEQIGIRVLRNEGFRSTCLAALAMSRAAPSRIYIWLASARTLLIRIAPPSLWRVCPRALHDWSSCTTRPVSSLCPRERRRSQWRGTLTVAKCAFHFFRTGRSGA